ncbi:NDR1/HIN1-like protein 1 [Wolffia australiana]
MSSENSGGGGVCRTIFLILLLLVFLLGIAILVFYLIYLPAKPRFTVLSVSIDATNSTKLQFTLSLHNPSRRAAVVYDRVAAITGFPGQPITAAVALPPLRQAAGSTVLAAPSLDLAARQVAGVVSMELAVKAQLRFEAGPVRSPWYELRAQCPLLFRAAGPSPAPLLRPGFCSVRINLYKWL